MIGHEKQSRLASINPLVSVVMPTRNQSSFIAQSIESVLSQSYSNIELLVIDGESKDGTIEILKRASSEDDRLKWISEPDTGPAQALNKGLSRLMGTVIGWLNSDDSYVDGTIQRVVSALQRDDKLLMVYGEGFNVDQFGTVISKYPTLPPSTPIEKFVEGCFISQPTVFFRRPLSILLGPFDESLKTAFDFDYWLRAFKTQSDRIGFIAEEQAVTRLYSSTITARNRQTVMLEGMHILRKHLGLSPKNWVFTYIDEVLSQKDLDGCTRRGKVYGFFEEAKHYLDPSDRDLIQKKIDYLLKA
jgi:glycosyltransferase involved in cell wall biosynthesis